MTPVEAARVRITDTLAKVEEHARNGGEYNVAAVSPDLMIRVCREALGVLDRHTAVEHAFGPGHGQAGEVYARSCRTCKKVESYDVDDVDWPCAEVKAVVRAWTP